MNTSIKNNNGFTLVEILIVVAIVGILAAIAIPSYRYVLDSARRTSSIAALDVVKTELEAYAGDMMGYPSSIDFTNFTDQDGNSIMGPTNWERVKDKIYSWDSYTVTSSTYTIKARAIDSSHTILTLTQTGVTF